MTCEKVPTAAEIEQAKKNMQDLDSIVHNTEESIVDSKGRERLTLDGALALFGFGVTSFTFATGGTLDSKNQLIRHSDELLYRYVGAGSFPLVVAPATNPVGNPDWEAFTATSLQALSGLTEPSDLDKSYRRKSTTAQIEAGDFPDGSRLEVADRSDARFNVEPAGGRVADGIKIIDATNGNVAVLAEHSPDVLMMGVDGTGVTDAGAQMQLIATDIDESRTRFMKIPNYKQTYKVDTTVAFTNPGIRIFGEQGPTYNRGAGKLGWIETAASPTFDLGNSRTYTAPPDNAADNWEVDNISIKQQSGVAARSKDGIVFTSRTDGPDRGGNIKSYAAIGLRYGVAVLGNDDLSTALATLTIENGVFQGNNYAVFSEGMIQGFSFTNNQCEQNVGGIKVSLTGGCHVTDNMLEGQGNVLEVTIPPVTGNNPQIEFARNYLEANTGDFVLKAAGSASQCKAKIGPNLLQTITATDYAILSGGIWHVEMLDNLPLVIEGSAVITNGSSPIAPQGELFKMRLAGDTNVPIAFLGNISGYANNPTQKGYTSNDPIVGALTQTPLGRVQCSLGSAFVTAPLATSVGDLVTVQVLGSFEDVGYTAIQVWTDTGGPAMSRITTNVFRSTRGKWSLLTFTYKALQGGSNVQFRITGATANDTVIAGMVAQNHGPSTGQAVDVIPCIPTLTYPA